LSAPRESAAPAAAGRADFRAGLAWLALGAAILVASATMDRLADQGVFPYAAPGLVPGLLGTAMLIFGGLLALRGRRAGAGEAGAPRRSLRPGRLAIVLALCLIFDLVLVGHGIPFWVAASLFVTVSILVLQHPERQAAGRGLDARALLVAAAIGLGAGAGATLLFQNLFLVHLP
jgi:hypothetical protein